VASGLAIKTVTSLVRDAVEREDLRIGDRVAGLSRASIILRDAIHRANKIIYKVTTATEFKQPQITKPILKPKLKLKHYKNNYQKLKSRNWIRF
jgi:hypothetical protein